MAFRQYVITLDGTTQSVKTALGLTDITDIPFRELKFQAGKANTGDVLVGDADLSATLYGFRLDPGDTALPITVGGGYDSGPLRLSDFYVRGADGEIVHISGVPF